MSLLAWSRATFRTSFVWIRCFGIVSYVLVGLIAGGCADDVSEETATAEPLDDTLLVDADLLLFSGDTDGQTLVVGLPGAVVGDAVRLQTSVTTPVVDGAFAAVVQSGTSLSLVARRSGSVGPTRSAVLPKGPADRSVNPALVSLVRDGARIRVVGLAGAAAASSTVVVATNGSSDQAGASQRTLADSAGSFDVELDAGSPTDGRVYFFSVPIDSDRASPFASREIPETDLPVLVTAARSESDVVLVLAPPGSVEAGSSVLVGNATVVGDTSGGFAACLSGLAGGESFPIVSKSASVVRSVPEDVGLVAPLSLGMTAQVTAGNIALAGPAPAAIGQLFAVNCDTGQWTSATSQRTGDVALLLFGDRHHAVAVAGVGRAGDVGTAQLLTAGTSVVEGDSVEPPDGARVVVSARTGGLAVVAGLTDSVPSWSTLQIAGDSTSVIARSGEDGSFGVEATANDGSLFVRRVLGPLSSNSLPRPVADPVPSVSRPLSGVITVEASGGELLVGGGIEPGAVVVNLDRGLTSAGRLVAGRLSATLPGDAGDTVAVFRARGLGELANPESSEFVIRNAAAFDVPMLVSARSSVEVGCVAIPWGASASIELSGDCSGCDVGLNLSDDSALALFDPALFDQASVITATSSGGSSERTVPNKAELNAGALGLGYANSRIILSSGTTNAGPEWVFVVATPSGAVEIVVPPQSPPWSVSTSLETSAFAYVFGIHRSTGNATVCEKRQAVSETVKKPQLLSVSPSPLVHGKSFEIGGLDLIGATVAIGAVNQVVSPDFATITGVLLESTPLGQVTLRVETTGGSAETLVMVVPRPKIASVDPQSPIIGDLATVTGTGFLDAPQVFIGATPQKVESSSDTEVTFRVDPVLAAGFGTVKVSNGHASDDLVVELQCADPVIATVTSPALLGDVATITGERLLGATVTISGVTQELVSQTAHELELLVSSATPIGESTITISTGCGSASAALVVGSDTPEITSTNPTPAVRTQPLNILGDHLAGAVVTLGGLGQVLTIDSKKGISLVVDPLTPLGLQGLLVVTPGGSVQVDVNVAAPPVIDSLSPNPAPVASLLTISGAFLDAATVTISGVSAVIGSATPTELVVTVPQVFAPGSHQLVVTTPGGVAEASLTVIGEPVITSVFPDPANIDQPLRIAGEELLGGGVELGGVIQAVTLGNNTEINIVVSPGTPEGQQVLRVTTAAGTAEITVLVVLGPKIIDVLPEPLAVGMDFEIAGERFVPGGTTVVISGVVQPLLESTETSATGTIAAGTPLGERTLKVVTADGSDAATVQVLQPPTVNSVSPLALQTGESVTVFGNALAGATISVVGIAATTTEVTDSKVVFTVPSGLGVGLTSVVLTTPAGTVAFNITVEVPPPTISQVTPNPVDLEENITITGQWMSGASVALENIPLSVVSASPTEMVLTVVGTAPVGDDLTLLLKTPGGQASVILSVLGPTTEPAVITGLNPNPVARTETLTITGSGLKGATVEIDGTPQTVLTTAPQAIELVVGANTPLGEQTVSVTGSGGSTSGMVAIVEPAPTIASVEPVQATTGQPVSVLGTNLADFTNLTLGGVKQQIFTEVTETQLTFVVSEDVAPGTSELRVVGPGGEATIDVEVLAGEVKPPNLVSVDPASAPVGATIALFGVNLTGSTFTIGGVAHEPLPGGGNSLVQLTISESVLAGYQPVVATRVGVGTDELTMLIEPAPPVAALVVASAGFGGGSEAGLAALPGSVVPGALVNIWSSGSPIVSVFADETGSFGIVLGAADLATSPGSTIMMEQIVDGELSDPLAVVIPSATPGAGSPPPAVLTRVEAASDMVRISGPPPTFGADDSDIFVVTHGFVGVQTAAQLHDEGGAIEIPIAPNAPVVVFKRTAGGVSPVLATVPTAFDPPIVSSGVVNGEVCVAGLTGTVTAKLGVALHDDMGELNFLEFSAVGGVFGTFSARAKTFEVDGPGPFDWIGDVGEQTWSVAAPLADSVPQLLTSVDGGQVTVSVAGEAAGAIFVVATPDGAAAAVFVDPAGNASVEVNTGSDEVWAWLVPLDTSAPSGCARVSLTP
ncbi:MAG: hypothetical protein ACI9OJ_000213 [Myxococcota bacterium]|jgi:hypothetical protein